MRVLRACPVWVFVLLCNSFTFAGDPQWVEVRSPNFSVITDAGEKKGRDVALHFEQMRSVFGTLMTTLLRFCEAWPAAGILQSLCRLIKR